MARMDHYQAEELTMVSQIPIRGVWTLYSRLGDLAGIPLHRNPVLARDSRDA